MAGKPTRSLAVGTRGRRWPQWLVFGPILGGLVLGPLVPVLFLVDTWRAAEQVGIDGGVVYMLVFMAVPAGMLGALAGLGAGIACAAITAPVERRGRPTRRFYTRVAVCVTAVLASVIGALAHRAAPGFDLVLFPTVPIGISILVAYWIGALVASADTPGTDGP
jgi:hypothetical protein